MANLDVGHIYTNPDPEDGQAQYDELPPEAIDYMIAAFKQKAGLGQQPWPISGTEGQEP